MWWFVNIERRLALTYELASGFSSFQLPVCRLIHGLLCILPDDLALSVDPVAVPATY